MQENQNMKFKNIGKNYNRFKGNYAKRIYQFKNTK